MLGEYVQLVRPKCRLLLGPRLREIVWAIDVSVCSCPGVSLRQDISIRFGYSDADVFFVFDAQTVRWKSPIVAE
jgi:hypothetical protein